MSRTIFLCGCLFLITLFTRAQTVTGRSNAIMVDVSKDKIKRVNMAYLNVGIEDANFNNTLQKNEQAFIRFTIRNMSKFASRPLLVRAYPAEAVAGLKVQDSLRIEPVQAGKTQQIRIPLQRTEELQAGTYVVAIEIREELIYETDQLEINVLAEGNQ